MYAAAIYPFLLRALVPGCDRGRGWLALTIGGAVAVLVGISRIAVGAHSGSEVIAGLVLGTAVSLGAIASTTVPVISIRLALPVLIAAWILLSPFQMPASTTHSLVTRLALKLSGHTEPYTRSKMLRSVPVSSGTETKL